MLAGEQATGGPKLEFFNAVKEAEARLVVSSLAQIVKASREGHWQAAVWTLERRYLGTFGRRVLEHSGPEGGAIPLAIFDQLVKEATRDCSA